MTADNAGARDGGTQIAKNADTATREYRVTAKDGVHLDGVEGSVKKGTKVTLTADGARGLLLEGSIEEV